jgi:glycerophosphoryl diester phosphodiesterase
MESNYLEPGQFANIAHRGGSLEAPENTIVAFSHAHQIDENIYFELDVHETKDGEIVVHHDGTLERTSDGKGHIADFTYTELQKFDEGYRFTTDGGKTFPFRGKDCKIPKLTEVLTTFPKSHLSIELKEGLRFFGDKVAKIVFDTQSQERICIAGEDHKTLIKTAKLMPTVCSGFSAREMKFNFVFTLLHLPNFFASTRGDVMQIPYSHNGHIVVTPAFLKRAHAHGKFVHVWTVNDEPTMRRLIEIEADGIITDAPTLLTRVLLNS